MEHRTCLGCCHFHVCTADPGYSEFTPGSEFTMGCTKDHWDFDAYLDGQKDLFKKITSARNCPDYEFNPKVLE